MVQVSPEPKRGYYAVREGDLVAYLRRGFVVIPCDGEAHRDARVDVCQRCDGQPWGWRVVRG